MPGDKVNLEFSENGAKRIASNRTVIASVWYKEHETNLDRDMYSLIVLNPVAPYYTVAIVRDIPERELLYVDFYQNHANIVPAVNGEPRQERNLGYVEIGGDY